MKRLKLNGISKENMTLQELYEDYCSYHNHSLRADSIANNKHNYSVLTSYFDRDLPITDMTKQIIGGYVTYLSDTRGYANSSINNRLKFIKKLLNYAHESNYITSTPKIKTVREDIEVQSPLSYEDLQRLLDKPTSGLYGEYRTWVAINLLVSTGIRQRDLINAKVEDFKVDKQVLHIPTSKGHKAFNCYLSTQMTSILSQWINSVRLKQNDYLFPNINGEQLQPITFKIMYSKYCKARGVTSSPHDLRRSYARHLYEQNIPLPMIQKLLHHSSVQTTMRYLRIEENEAKATQEKVDILAQLKPKGRIRVK